jgi:glycosyltransferase involved in cell wall biosynthesis
VPSHPAFQGNRIRIYNMLSDLRRLGCHITYVYSPQPLADSNPYDTQAMEECWDRFYLVPSVPQGTSQSAGATIVSHVAGFLKKWLPFLHWRIRKYWRMRESFVKHPVYVPVEKLHDRCLHELICELSKIERFDVVLLEYIFQSKVLEYFDHETIKIIDTHDSFTDKHKIYLERIGTFGGPSATKEEEARALERADVIIAIQNTEEEFFSRITDKRVVTIGHLVPEIKNRMQFGRRSMLFVGAIQSPNLRGITYFVKEVLPRVRMIFPDARLLLAGRICDAVDSDDVIRLGVVKDIEMAYDLADVVISPIFFGTGLKIKNIEALSYCKPLVTTSFCAKELGEDAEGCFLQADTPEEFVQAISQVFSSREFAEGLSQRACDFVERYNARNLETLKEIFNA